MQVGESEKRLAEVFRKARQSSPCIIFFDEIQAVFSHRSDSSSSTKMVQDLHRTRHAFFRTQ
jgi:SpoVK/Ycf46/Vps4 family AAA+-type ATPase